jgi:hypothetical protein
MLPEIGFLDFLDHVPGNAECFGDVFDGHLP